MIYNLYRTDKHRQKYVLKKFIINLFDLNTIFLWVRFMNELIQWKLKDIKYHPLCDPDVHILANRNILPLTEMLCFIAKTQDFSALHQCSVNHSRNSDFCVDCRVAFCDHRTAPCSLAIVNPLSAEGNSGKYVLWISL